MILSLIFDFIILRNLEKYLGWLSTSILYMGSGIGGNIISGVFVPYSPEVMKSLVYIILHVVSDNGWTCNDEFAMTCVIACFVKHLQ